MSLSMVRVLGWLVIAHGVSHAVLPLRGSLAPATLIDDWTPAVLYAVGMVGFVTAGFGLLGLRPLDRAISPLLVLASGLSLVAISRFGDPRLWFGAACDVSLLILGLWRAYSGWPSHPAHGRLWHVAAVTAGVAFLLYVATATFLYPWHRNWGSTRAELEMALPGDAVPRDPEMEIQRAVTIAAPPEQVWAWLVQIGRDRTGFFGDDWLERAIGAEVGNVGKTRPEWQSREPGDFVGATRRGDVPAPLPEGAGWRATDVQPGHALVLENGGTFVLLPTGDGGTRFIIRSTISNRNINVLKSALNMLAFQVPHFIMQRRMMLTIKTLAEQRRSVRATLDRSSLASMCAALGG